MFWWDWMQSLLRLFGFNRRAKLVIVGLDNAGKSTLLNVVKTDKLAQFPPTGQTRCEEMTIGGLTIQAYDLGGHPTMRRVWMDYFPAVDGIVFIVDASHQERFAEARHEITSILEDENIPPIPVLILGNKTDKMAAVGMEELIMELGIYKHLYKEPRFDADGEVEPGSHRACRVFMCSLVKRQGYGDGFRWLAKATNK